MKKNTDGRITLRPTGEDLLIGELQPGVQIYAASVSTARQLLTKEDDFVRNQSRFDRQARLNIRFEVMEVSKDIYLDYVSSQVMKWSDVEMTALGEIIKSLNARFSQFELGLPEAIYLIKTTGQEEGFAAYTRGLNTICLPANMVSSVSMTKSFSDPLHPANDFLYLEDILNHECFHLFSKNNPERRCELYKAVNYYPTGHEVELPDVPWGSATGADNSTLPQLKITNPDASKFDVYIKMDVPMQPGDINGETVSRSLLPVLLARSPYNDGGMFFEYLHWWFLAIECDANGDWVAMMHDEKPLLYDSEPLLPQYMKLIGSNIEGEIFHPDEILAQNFVLASKVPTPDLLSTIQKLVS